MQAPSRALATRQGGSASHLASTRPAADRSCSASANGTTPTWECSSSMVRLRSPPGLRLSTRRGRWLPGLLALTTAWIMNAASMLILSSGNNQNLSIPEGSVFPLDGLAANYRNRAKGSNIPGPQRPRIALWFSGRVERAANCSA
jgi:hypothetical protein